MSDEARDGGDNPGVVAPPPLIFAGALAAGLAANALRPVGFLPRAARWSGLPLAFCGLALLFSSLRTMRRAQTDVRPTRPTTAIVAAGPYRFTRNPIYVGMALVYGGVAALANALPAAVLLPVVLGIVQKGVVEREERYLERKFGDEYLAYKRRVRRWA